MSTYNPIISKDGCIANPDSTITRRFLFWFDGEDGIDHMFTALFTEAEAIDKAFDLWANGCECISIEETETGIEIFNSSKFEACYC